MTQQNTPFVRKHFFINRSLQGKYMLTFLIPMLVMMACMLMALYFAVESVVSTTTSTIKSDIQEKTTTHLMDKTPTTDDYQRLVTDIRQYLLNYQTNPAHKKFLMQTLLIVVGVGVFLLIIQIMLLTIFFSHKIAGPIYRFERFCHEMVNGDYRQSIGLRKGDEMKNLAHLLTEVARVTREHFLALREASSAEKRKEVFDSLSID